METKNKKIEEKKEKDDYWFTTAAAFVRMSAEQILDQIKKEEGEKCLNVKSVK